MYNIDPYTKVCRNLNLVTNNFVQINRRKDIFTWNMGTCSTFFPYGAQNIRLAEAAGLILLNPGSIHSLHKPLVVFYTQLQ